VNGTALLAASVTVAFRERAILRDVSFHLEHGERVALIGPNGAGKSTLLRVLAGTLRPTAGQVEMDGLALASLSRSSIAKRLAVVPQQTALPFSMKVEAVVALGRLPHEGSIRGASAADRAAVAAAIDRVGLGHLMGRDARELSLGERQLVLLALAVAQQAPVLLLDEPTVHLDLRHQVEAMELLRDLNERDGTALVAVLHDLGLAAHFFPRLVIVERGRIIADGPPGEVLTDRVIREVFGVEPALVRLAAGVNGG
jgi:iron complex transport system ATP-binding protein